jgi:hypothetical protein
MHSYTAPQEFFREIVETQRLISELWKADITHVHWPSYYQFYIDMDRLYWRVHSAAESLTDHGVAGITLAFEERRERINSCFSALQSQQKHIIRWLSNFGRRSEMLSLGDKNLSRFLQCHFQPKSEWFHSFFEEYSAGAVSADSLTLERTIQLFDPTPTYRIEDIIEKNLVQHHSFELATEGARQTLVDIGRQAAKLVDEVCHEMGEFLVQRCTIKELLHPSTF